MITFTQSLVIVYCEALSWIYEMSR